MAKTRQQAWPKFPQFTELPVELQRSISRLLDKADLRNLAHTNKAQRQFYRHEIMQRFIESNRVVSIAGTSSSSYFVTAEGFVFACGDNANGSLGMGDRNARISPARVPGLSNVKKVIICDCLPLFLTYSGELWEVRNTVITRIELPPIAKVEVFSGQQRDSALVLAKDGSVYARGDNAHCRLGLQRYAPQFEQVPRLERIKKILITWCSSLYLDDVGNIYVVGLNGSGQLALRDQLHRQVATVIPALSSDRPVKNFWSNGNVTFMQDVGGDIYACGENDAGQLGLGVTSEYCVTPTLVPQLKNIKEIRICYKSCYAITHDGHVFAWGDNKDGKLGLGDQVRRVLPTRVLGLSSVAAISFNDDKVFFHTQHASTYVCGKRINQLPGMEALAPVSEAPILVPALERVKQDCHGSGVYTFLRRDGIVCGWGDNQYHALGLEDPYYSTFQFLELPHVYEYLVTASPDLLLHYANQGRDYYHNLCFETALLALSQIQTVEFIEATLPFLKSDRCKQSSKLQALFPGFELLAYCDAAISHAYTTLLVMYRALSGPLRSDLDLQHKFVCMLKEIVSSHEQAELEDEVKVSKQSRAGQEGVSTLRRYGVFAEQLQTLPGYALQQAADILADRLAKPDLQAFKRKAEDEIEDAECKEEVKKPRK